MTVTLRYLHELEKMHIFEQQSSWYDVLYSSMDAMQIEYHITIIFGRTEIAESLRSADIRGWK